MEHEPIVVEETFDASLSEVWQAISDQDQMRQWFFETMGEFQPEVGFETQFDVQCEGVTYPHLWKVTEVVPQRRLAYQWRYGGYPGDSQVAWELSETPDGTKLTLTHSGGETFPQNNPIFSRASGLAGWRYFLQESLKAFLNGQRS